MQYAVVIFPKINNSKINEIRKKYDPYHKEYKPHITLIYPFKTNLDVQKLVKEAIKDTKPFTITLEKVRQSETEFYIYLLVNNGLKNIIDLRSKLVKGNARQYPPHLTLGKLESQEAASNAIDDIKKQNIKFECIVDSITLIKQKKDTGETISYEEIKL